MKYGCYIKEHKIWLILFCYLLLSIEIFLLTLSGSGWLMIYVALVLVCAFFLGTYVDYRKWAAYFKVLDELMEEFDRKYLLCELLEQGDSQEERKLKEIFYQMELSMNEQVSNYRRNSKEYKEYVETWVHEIKIPIAAMKMMLANHKEMDFGIEDEIGRLEGYVEQALFYARSNDVEKDYLIKQIGLQETVQNVILKRKKMLRGMNAKIQIHDLEREVFSDSKWLEFMVGQVVDNCIKYGEKDKLHIEIFSEEKDNAILLHIRDNGAGIKSTEVAKVFDKGFTGSNGRKNSASTGIGLYLCRKLCQRLEHNIVLEAQEGEGTTVTFIFPVAKMMSVV